MISFPIAPVALLAEVLLGRPTATNGDHVFFRSRSCQERRPAWGNSKRKPFIMAIPHEKAVLTPKPAGGVGKNEGKTVYHGDREKNYLTVADFGGRMWSAAGIAAFLRDGEDRGLS